MTAEEIKWRPNALERLLRATIRPRDLDACWDWGLARTSNGYGKFGRTGGGWVLAHRASWMLHVGPIPDGLHVLHRCDNPPCCNPRHLFLGTAADNTRDMISKGRAATGDRNGSRRHPERLPRGDEHRARKDPSYLARGEQVANARLTEPLVSQIRDEYDPPHPNQYDLAAKYGVSVMAINRVLLRRTWVHVR